VDTGVDDALAILYVVAHPGLELAGVSCVTGNASLPQVVANTCAVLDAAGAADVPVAAGAERPLIEPLHTHISHGANGLGGIELPSSARGLDPQPAPEMLRGLILGAADRVTLVALAPLTNVALLLRTDPRVAPRLHRIVVLGGSTAGDAEFNLAHDPEAAWIVLHTGVPVTMYPLEVFRQVAIAEGTACAWAEQHHPALRLAGQLLARRRSRDERDRYAGLIGDAGTLMFLTNPELFTVRRRLTTVGLSGPVRGRLLVHPLDRLTGTIQDSAEPSPVDVVEAVDVGRVARTFQTTLQSRYQAPAG